MIEFIASHLGISAAFAIFILLISTLISIAIYFIPSAVAFYKKCPSLLSIIALNLFLGWSLLGWVASLVWALRPYDYAPSSEKKIP